VSTPRPPLSAAELAAGQVAAIVTAAEHAADEIAGKAEREARELKRDAERDAKRMRQDAERELARAREQAQTEAVRIGEIARKEAEERIKGAEQAANDVLAQTQVISGGLRQLAASLEGQADRILREVQAGHRRMLEDLRVPTVGRRTDSEPRVTRRAADRSSSANPLGDVDIPSWVEDGS